MSRPTAISLFTGCGGSDLGLIASGFNVVMANDILPHAQKVYLSNCPETEYVLGDIRELEKFPSTDLLAGCYPCQGFSQGGVRKASRGINYLYREFARALVKVDPKAFIVENVSGMRRSDFRYLLDDQIKTFSEIGYSVKWQMLDAKDYGVAQDRKRIFIVGIRKDFNQEYNFPQSTHGEDKQPYKTIKEALAGLPENPIGEYNTEPFHWYYLSRNRYRNWHECSRTVVARSRHVTLHPSSPPLRRIHTDKWVFEHDGPARRFSFRECSRLQGFPNEMQFPDSKLENSYKVVGNAVPPPLFAAVASTLPEIF